MSKSQRPIYLFISILSKLPFKYKFQVYFLLFLMFFGGIIEFVTIGLLFPFLRLISGDFNQANKIDTNLPLFNFFIFNKIELHQLGILLLLVITLAAILKLYIIRKSGLISASVGNKLGRDAYYGILYKEYKSFLKLDTAKLLTTISIQVTKVEGTINVVLKSICSLIILIFVFASLIYIYPFLTVIVTLALTLIYFMIISYTRSRLRKCSYVITNEQKKSIKLVKESITGFRDIKINNSENFFLKNYKKSDSVFRKTNAFAGFLDLFPKYTIESIIIISIITTATFVPLASDSKLIAALGIFAFAAQRLLPSLQQIYSGWARLNSTQSDLENIFDLLYSSNNLNKTINTTDIKREEKSIKELNFSQIQLKNISFCYPNESKNVFSNINLNIKSGDVIGLKGKSGSGKTTLVDIIVGLLEPTCGEILIDGNSLIGRENNLLRRNWSRNVSYVPQNIFISDQPIHKNVAFGIPDHLIDLNRVKHCLKMAQISYFAEDSLEIFTKKNIGDYGNRISGGQRQRIGIARALYKRSSLLVLDEATSALDYETEKKVVDLISGLSRKITIIMVAHRLSTLSICTKIYDLNNGKICLID